MNALHARIAWLLPAALALAGCGGRAVDGVDDPRITGEVPGAVTLHVPLPLALAKPPKRPETWYHVYGAERLAEDLVRFDLMRTRWDGPDYRNHFLRIAMDCGQGRLRVLGDAARATAAEQGEGRQASREIDVMDSAVDEIAGHVCVQGADCVDGARDGNACEAIHDAQIAALHHRDQIEKMRAGAGADADADADAGTAPASAADPDASPAK